MTQKYSEKYRKIYILLGGYFHQDWNCDYDNFEAVISGFVEEEERSVVEETINELKNLLKEQHTREEWLRIIYRSFGCDYSLEARNLEPVEWLQTILKQLENELLIAEKKEK